MKKIEIFVGSDSAFEKIVPKSARNLSEMAVKLDDGNKKIDMFVNIPGQPEPKPKKKKKLRVQDFVIHNIEWMNNLRTDDNKEAFTQCIAFESSFRSPKKGGGAWEANEEYTWSWWLARSEGGEWNLMTWGY